MIDQPGIIYKEGFYPPEIFTSEGFLRLSSPRIDKASIFIFEPTKSRIVPDNTIKFMRELKEDYMICVEYFSKKYGIRKNKSLDFKLLVNPETKFLCRPFDNDSEYHIDSIKNIFREEGKIYSNCFSLYNRDELEFYRDFFKDTSNDIQISSSYDLEFWKMFFLSLCFLRATAVKKQTEDQQCLMINIKSPQLAYKIRALFKILNIVYSVSYKDYPTKKKDKIDKYTTFTFFVGKEILNKIKFSKYIREHTIKFKFSNLTKKEMLAIYAAACQFSSRPFDDKDTEEHRRQIHYFSVSNKRYSSLLQYILTCFGVPCYYNLTNSVSGAKILVAHFNLNKTFHLMSRPKISAGHTNLTLFQPNKAGFYLVRFSPYHRSCFIWLESKNGKTKERSNE